MARNPFAFLDSESPLRKTLLLLLAILRKQEKGEISLSLEEITAVEDGASFHIFPDDTSTSLVLRFARRGAEAYFLTPSEEQPSPTKTTRVVRPSVSTPEVPSPRHAIHDDLDLSLREDEMVRHAQEAQRRRTQEARAEAGAMPWRTSPPTRQ